MERYAEELKKILLDSFNQFIHIIKDYLPNILGALALLLAGLVLAWFSRWLIVRLGKGLDRLVNAIGFASLNIRLKWPIAEILGWLVYWLIILFFIIAAVENLGLPVLADMLGRFLHQLPSLIIAGMFVLGGVFLGNSLRDRISVSARSAGLKQTESLGNWIRIVVIVLAIIVALAQVGLNVRLFEQILAIFIAAAAGSIALAFGLGAGSTVSNIIAARYVRRNYRVGQHIRIQDMKGRILELLPTGVILDTENGRTFVPAKIFDQEASILLDDQSLDGD